MKPSSPPQSRRQKLRLYVASDSPAGQRALESRLRLLDALGDSTEIEIIDILAHPDVVESAGILATPTLSDESTTPPRRLIGDISDLAQVIDFFGYRKTDVGP